MTTLTYKLMCRGMMPQSDQPPATHIYRLLLWSLTVVSIYRYSSLVPGESRWAMLPWFRSGLALELYRLHQPHPVREYGKQLDGDCGLIPQVGPEIPRWK